MTQAALRLEAAGFKLELIGFGDLWVTPKSRLSDGARQHIKAHKGELVDYLRRREAQSAPRDGNLGGIFFPAPKGGTPLFAPYPPLTAPPVAEVKPQRLTAPAASPPDTTPAVDWHEADRAYQAHHWTCPQCRAAGKGYGQGCAEGQALWDAYEAAPMPELAKVKRVTPAPQPTELPRAAPYRMTPRSEPEIVRMVELHRRAVSVGLPDSNDTDRAIDALMDAPDGMACCFACAHLRGSSPDRWQCAGRGHDLAGLPLAHAFVVRLHHCNGYAPPVA